MFVKSPEETESYVKSLFCFCVDSTFPKATAGKNSAICCALKADVSVCSSEVLVVVYALTVFYCLWRQHVRDVRKVYVCVSEEE